MRGLTVLAGAVLFAAPAVAQIRPESATPEARAAIGAFGACVVRASPGKTRATLTMDFTSRDYTKAMRVLADVNRDCHRGRGYRSMRTGGLPFAAAMAEAILASDPRPLSPRLLKAAPISAPTYSPTDRVAMCVVRSDPDGVARLLQSGIASAEETTRADALRTAVKRCTPPGLALDLTPYALRAIVATASYRLLAAAEGATE